MRLGRMWWLLPFVVLSVLLGVFGWHSELKGLEPALLTVGVTIAIFAVNFSFLEYQFSAYRPLLRGMSVVQIAASVVVLVLAILPLEMATLNRPWYPTLALVLIPLIASSSVWLATLARSEASAITVLNRQAAPKVLRKFFAVFVEDAEIRLKELEDLQLTKPADMPTHEWDVRTAPSVRIDDPFALLSSAGLIAIQTYDLHTFQTATAQALDAARAALDFKHTTKVSLLPSTIQTMFQAHAREPIHRLAMAACELDKTGAAASKFLQTCEHFVSVRAGKGEQTSELVAHVLADMRQVAKHLLLKGDSSSALIPVVVARQAAQKGMDSKSTDGVFRYELAYLVRVIQQLGHEGIQAGDSDYLYRCLDACWWLGVAAIRADDVQIGTACFRAFAQLGREARAKDLECFWEGCAQLPADHAKHRILSTGGGIAALEPERRKEWLEIVAEALSRLHGEVCKVWVQEEDGKPRVVWAKTAKPYTMVYSDADGTRTINYSDLTFVKDLRFTGIAPGSNLAVVRGPEMPISLDDEK